MKENDFRCEYSGVELTTDTVELDHVVPIKHGGEHVEENIALVHSVVNRMKGTMTHDEFVRWCKLVTQWNS